MTKHDIRQIINKLQCGTLIMQGMTELAELNGVHPSIVMDIAIEAQKATDENNRLIAILSEERSKQ